MSNIFAKECLNSIFFSRKVIDKPSFFKKMLKVSHIYTVYTLVIWDEYYGVKGKKSFLFFYLSRVLSFKWFGSLAKALACSINLPDFYHKLLFITKRAGEAIKLAANSFWNCIYSLLPTRTDVKLTGFTSFALIFIHGTFGFCYSKEMILTMNFLRVRLNFRFVWLLQMASLSASLKHANRVI